MNHRPSTRAVILSVCLAAAVTLSACSRGTNQETDESGSTGSLSSQTTTVTTSVMSSDTDEPTVTTEEPTEEPTSSETPETTEEPTTTAETAEDTETASDSEPPTDPLPQTGDFNHDLWEAGRMGNLPAPPADITGAAITDESVSYNLESFQAEAFNGYIEQIREAGFIYEGYLTENSMYTATNAEGQDVSVWLYSDSEEGYLTLTESDPPDTESTDIYVVGKEHAWNPSEMGGLPDSGDKITSYWLFEGDAMYYFEVFEDPSAYINIIKEAGYDVDSYLMTTDTGLMYSAYNENGDYIYLTAETGSSATLSFNTGD